MEVEYEEEKEEYDLDLAAADDMEVEDEMPSAKNEQQIVNEMQTQKSQRRKAILKELEVCDLLDLRNPQYVAEYASNCWDAMKQEEGNFLIPKNFLENTMIKEKHRRKLFEWLSDFMKKFKLLPETYFITCKLIDLAITKMGCKQKDLHQLSLGCLLIAMKYEEIYPPSLKTIIRAASRDPDFTQQDIVRWEFDILKALDFGVTFPTAYRFLM